MAKKYLALFIEKQNAFSRMFGGKVYDTTNLTSEDRAKLRDALENALSPENLSCDGELRGAALTRKHRELKGALDELQEAR